MPLWEGRSWLPIEEPATRPSVSFLSYNVLSDARTSFSNHFTAKNWDVRCRTLIKEIQSYDADIICLQDIDHFDDWWRPQLKLLGYDPVYKERTQLKDFHYEGVLIAFKNEVFNLFKTVQIEFNDAIADNSPYSSSFRDASKTDDVGILLFLQPFKADYINTAICVGCGLLSDKEAHNEIRMVQCQYLTSQIELENKEFQAPVLLGMSMYDSPSSMAYALMRTGRTALLAQVPKKASRPYGVSESRTSCMLKWYPPPRTLADPPVTKFRIAYRPGGSNILGFKSEIEVDVGDCTKYVEKIDKNRNRRIVPVDELQYVINDLCSDVPYEFKIAGINEMGIGGWSAASDPVVMINPDNAPELPGLQNLSNLTQLNESLEVGTMKGNDWNTQNAFNAADELNSQTQLTPRTIEGKVTRQVSRGRVLPVMTNPREGWKDTLGGTQDKSVIKVLAKESVISRSILRHKGGERRGEFVDGVWNRSHTEEFRSGNYSFTVGGSSPSDTWGGGNTFGGIRIEGETDMTEGRLGGEEDDNGVLMINNNNTLEGKTDTNNNAFDDIDGDDESVGFDVEEECADENGYEDDYDDNSEDVAENDINDATKDLNDLMQTGEPTSPMRPYSSMRPYTTSGSYTRAEGPPGDGKHDVVLDGREVMERLGLPNARDVHSLNLRSAYESYSVGGEPLLTTALPASKRKSHEFAMECMDYIFYSGTSLSIQGLLSLPMLSQLHGQTPLESITEVDLSCAHPFAHDGDLFDDKVNEIIKKEDRNRAQKVSRSKVNEVKRTLKATLDKSRLAGCDGIEIEVGKGLGTKERKVLEEKQAKAIVESTFFGGLWVPLSKSNTARSTKFLPNDVYCSSHLAVGARFVTNDFLAACSGV